MPTIYALGAGSITIGGDDFDDEELSGFTQGTGEHLDGLTITLNERNWEAIEVSDNDPNFDDNDGNQRLDGAQVFDEISYPDNRRIEAEYSLVLEDPDGNRYNVYGFNIVEGGGPSFGTVEGLAFEGGEGGFPPINVPLTVISSAEGPSVPTADLAFPFCFGKGCMIATPEGSVAVETLTVGDWVLTVDRGAQQITWAGSTHYDAAALHHDVRMRPVLIRKGAFGPALPARDMRVSRQHRLLVTDWRAQLMFGESEVLVPAAKLVNDTTIIIDRDITEINYYHIMCDRHEILWSDGIKSESFLPGAKSEHAHETEAEIYRLFPELAATEQTALARLCISDKRAALLAPRPSGFS